MQVKDVMTAGAEYLPPSTTLMDAARKMRDLDCGFLPVSDEQRKQLQGVITDRDITVRAVANGLSPHNERVDRILSDRVLYCYQDDSIEAAAESMEKQRVYRLIVLDNKDAKKLVGVLSLGDIMRHDHEKLGGHVARFITQAQAAA